MSLDIASVKNGERGNISLEKQALTSLRNTLRAQTQWIKVHAAEYLIWIGYTEEVRKEFMEESRLYGSAPMYRIGVWRVLAAAESNRKKKLGWVSKIFDAFEDRNGSDQLYAIESLAKLRISPYTRSRETMLEALQSADRTLSIFAHWAAAYESDALMEEKRKKFLDLAISDPAADIRSISAYILRRLKGLTRDQWMLLCRKTLAEPDSSGLKNTLLNTAFNTFPEYAEGFDTFRQIKEAMLRDHILFSAEKRVELALALAEKGNMSDLPLLQSFLNDEHIQGIFQPDSNEAADVRAAAAYAILKISRS